MNPLGTLTITIGDVCLWGETHMAQVSTQYREEVGQSSDSMLMLLVPVLAVAVGYAIYRWYGREPIPVDTPEGLVHELAEVHGLPASATKLLLRIGRAAELRQPATLFLNIDQFETAVAKAAKRLRYAAAEQKQLGLIRRRVFSV